MSGFVLALTAIAGCGLTSQHPDGGQQIHVTGSAGAAHNVRVVRGTQTVPAGRRIELLHRQRVGGRGVRLDLVMRVSPPSVAHHALSSYAYPPQHGNYLTFVIAVRNRGEGTVLVKPTDFTVSVGGGETRVTSYDGNAPYSGAHQQLDATALQPGQSVRHPLTFDVGAVHGVMSYAPGRKPAIRWRF